MDNVRQEELPKNLALALLTAHYDALAAGYKSEIRRRFNMILRQHSRGKLPDQTRAAMGIHFANELEKAIAATSHEAVQKVIDRGL